MSALALTEEVDLRALVLDLQQRVRELEGVNAVLEGTVTYLRRELAKAQDELNGEPEPDDGPLDTRRELGVSLRGGE